MPLFNETPIKPDVSDTSELPEANVDRPDETEGWKKIIELPDDTGGWQDNIELPNDTGGWVDSIVLPDDSVYEVQTTKPSNSAKNKRTEKNLDNQELLSAFENSGANVEKPGPITEKIAETISTPEGIKELMEKHPEKAELWESQLVAIETLNDPEASPAEIRSAQAKLSILKGQIMEAAVKDTLAEAGFDVEAQQRVVEEESGGTRPDVIAVNNTDQPIEVFGTTIKSGETLSIECKCGGSAYMTNQLNNHIPNQLSGHEGTKVLLTTSDIKGVPDGLASRVCGKYGAILMALDVSVAAVEKAIKEVAEN